MNKELTWALDRETLYLYLRLGLSTRRIDKALGRDPSRTKGWFSWVILKDYALTRHDRGCLFTYSPREAERCILQVRDRSAREMRASIRRTGPAALEKYRNQTVEAAGERQLHDLLSGLTRNLTRNFFIKQKKALGGCQLIGCTNRKVQIDTAHITDERPDIFMREARALRTRLGNGLYRYPIYPIIREFLQAHRSPKSIAFLCRPHHNELDTLKLRDRAKYRSMLIKIKFD